MADAALGAYSILRCDIINRPICPGTMNMGTQNLLFVTGFDQATKQYNYRVNENVGVTQANGTVYQIQLGARYGF